MNFGINKGISSIDVAAINETASQIFANAAQKDAKYTFKVDYSKFNRPELGADLYSQRLDIEEIQQISIRNAGLDTNFAQNQTIKTSVQYFNKIAALNAYDASDRMNGKIYVHKEDDFQKQNSRNAGINRAAQSIAQTDNTHNDKKGSNPFRFMPFNATKEDEKDSQ